MTYEQFSLLHDRGYECDCKGLARTRTYRIENETVKLTIWNHHVDNWTLEELRRVIAYNYKYAKQQFGIGDYVKTHRS